MRPPKYVNCRCGHEINLHVYGTGTCKGDRGACLGSCAGYDPDFSEEVVFTATIPFTSLSIGIVRKRRKP